MSTCEMCGGHGWVIDDAMVDNDPEDGPEMLVEKCCKCAVFKDNAEAVAAVEHRAGTQPGMVEALETIEAALRLPVDPWPESVQWRIDAMLRIARAAIELVRREGGAS